MTHSFPTRRSSDLLSWGRHDYCQYAIRQWDIAPDGNQAYQYDFVWAELQAQARIDGTVFQNKNDLLRLQSVWFTAPQDTAGTRSEEHTSELQSLMRISYAVFCLKKKKRTKIKKI